MIPSRVNASQTRRGLFYGDSRLCLFDLFFLSDGDIYQIHQPETDRLNGGKGGAVKQVWVPLSRISGTLRKAVVAAEDGTFYAHEGIDFYELRESFKKNLRKGRLARGFSTITMQLARNLYLSPQKTITRKLLEILIALKMEKELSKDRILEIYLNVIEWGKGVYGAEAAARHYFKKSAASLSAEEAVFLAAIIPNPRKWGRQPPGSYVQKRMGVLLSRLGLSSNIEDLSNRDTDFPALVDPPDVEFRE